VLLTTLTAVFSVANAAASVAVAAANSQDFCAFMAALRHRPRFLNLFLPAVRLIGLRQDFTSANFDGSTRADAEITQKFP
jgi:hypothetical protein